MADFGWVMLGCVLGGMARYFVSGLVARHIGATFPWGTLTVNVSGALVIGFIAANASVAHGWFSDLSVWRLGVVGFLGSYTTVSSFSLQTLALVQEGETGRALGNITLSLGLCLSAAAFGLLVGTKLFAQS